MGAVFNYIQILFNQIIYAISNIRVFDVLDIIVVAFLIYKAIEFLRENRAGQLVKGMVVLIFAYALATWWDIVLLRWLLNVIMDSAIIVVAVIFQPELRRILEKLGHTKIARTGQIQDEETRVRARCIDSVCKAIGMMQEKKMGALFVFERATQLGEIINTGTFLDAAASSSMAMNIFFPNSPLHDGALVIRDGRFYAAGCILPLTQNPAISSTLGTRHRAAIGMSENSDAVVLVVSEETGIISIVCDGQITRNYTAVSAGAELRRIFIDNESEKAENVVVSTFKKIPIFKKLKEKGADNGEEKQ